MNKQRIFDRALNGVRAQGCFSHAAGACRYSGPNGSRCAIGHNIDDIEVCKLLDSLGTGKIDTLAFNHAEWNDDVRSVFDKLEVDLSESRDRGEIYFLLELQDAHDMEAFSGSLQGYDDRMKAIAEFHGLVYTPPK